MSDLLRDVRLNDIYYLLLIRCGYEAGIVSKKDYRSYVLNDMQHVDAVSFLRKYQKAKYQKAKKKREEE